MKQTLKSIFTLTLILISFASASIAQEKPKRIAILEIEAKNTPKSYAEIIRDILEVKLQKSRLFDVIERNQIKTILNEQNFQMSVCNDSECAVKLGKILSADLVAVGSLSKISRYNLSFKIVDVKSASILFADTESAENDAELDKAADIIIDRITADIQLNNIGSKTYASVSTNHDSEFEKPVFFGLYYRYGRIIDMEIPVLKIPATYGDPVTLKTEKMDTEIMEITVAPKFPLNKVLSIRTGFNAKKNTHFFVDETNENENYNYLENNGTTLRLFTKDRKEQIDFFGFGLGFSLFVEYPNNKLRPFLGFGINVNRNLIQNKISNYFHIEPDHVNVGTIDASSSTDYELNIDKTANLINAETELGFIVNISENICLSFSGIYSYCIYGNLVHDLKIQKTKSEEDGDQTLIPDTYQNLDQKIDTSIVNNKRMAPTYYLQFGVEYKI